MTYTELKRKHQEEINRFPLGFAFSDTQFEEMMRKWELDAKNPEDLKKIISIGAGGFIQKKDLPAFKEMLIRHKEEKAALLKRESDLIEALVYELHNHEYGYSRDSADMEAAIGALDLSWADVDEEKHPFTHKCLIQAERRCIKEFNENN